MNKTYKVAGHRFRVSGEKICQAVSQIKGFLPFECKEEKEDILFEFVDAASEPPQMEQVQYTFSYEDVSAVFGRWEEGFLLSLKPEKEEAFHLWTKDGESMVIMNGNWSMRLYRFALWVGFGLMTLPYQTVAIHSSCIVLQEKAVLFLGESGTGKSTHTRLWREHIKGAVLLNDDSPMIRVEEDKVWAYGSPWSGKTPCYKQERYELAGCVRLSQAPYNRIKQLSVLQGYGAIHPSCPPEFAYDSVLYDHVSGFISKLLSKVPFYHLACLPDEEAARLSCSTILGSAYEESGQ